MQKCVDCRKPFYPNKFKPSPMCDECTGGESWAAVPKVSNEEKSEPAKEPASFTNSIPSTELRKLLKTSNEEIKTESPKTPSQRNDIMQTERSESNSDRSGVTTIAIVKTPVTGLTTKRMQSDSAPSSIPEKIEETLPVDLSPSSVDLNREISHSINSLNQLETESFALMKGLRDNHLETVAKAFDPDRVNAAVNCGNQIVMAMKMKLDLMKFSKEVNRNGKV